MSTWIWMRMFNRFLDVMFGAKHTTSSIQGTWNRENGNGRYFMFFTIDAEAAAKAKVVLDQAGLICHEVLDGPQSYRSDDA